MFCKGARLWAGIAIAALLAACGDDALRRKPEVTPTVSDAAILDDLERRTFDFFWETANPANGLIPDRVPSGSFSSIAAVGFALTAYPIGVERGYVTHSQAIERVLTTLRFLRDAPQGPDAQGVVAHRGRGEAARGVGRPEGAKRRGGHDQGPEDGEGDRHPWREGEEARRAEEDETPRGEAGHAHEPLADGVHGRVQAAEEEGDRRREQEGGREPAHPTEAVDFRRARQGIGPDSDQDLGSR